MCFFLRGGGCEEKLVKKCLKFLKKCVWLANKKNNVYTRVQPTRFVCGRTAFERKRWCFQMALIYTDIVYYTSTIRNPLNACAISRDKTHHQTPKFIVFFSLRGLHLLESEANISYFQSALLKMMIPLVGYRGFLKWWYPNKLLVFLLRMTILGCEMGGSAILGKHPYVNSLGCTCFKVVKNPWICWIHDVLLCTMVNHHG